MLRQAERLTQVERTEHTRRAIIEAALQIIGDEGYRALTSTRLEQVSGVSRGLVGYHFRSKHGLVEAVIVEAGQAYVRHIVGWQAAGQATGLEGVLALIGGYLSQLGRDPRRSRVMLILIVESIAAQPVLRGAIRALNEVLRDSLREQLVRGQEDGSVRVDLDPRAESVVLAGLLRGLAVQWLADPDGVDLGQATDRALVTVRQICELTR